MPTEFRLPELGENIEKGDLIKVLVAVGDVIAPAQSVIELETDKATLEVPSSVGGKVESIHVKAGEQVKVGQLILTVANGAGPGADQAKAEAKPRRELSTAAAKRGASKGNPAAPAAAAAAPAPAQAEAPAAGVKPGATAEFRLPELGENIEKGDLIKILVAAGDVIAKDQAVLELETDKATVEVPSSVSGKVQVIYVKAGEQVKVGQLILTVATDGTQPAPQKSNQETNTARAVPWDGPATRVAIEPEPAQLSVSSSTPAPESARLVKAFPIDPAERCLVPAAPSVRRMARELGVDIADVPGSGPGGRISAEDVKAHIRSLTGGGTAPGSTARETFALPDFTRWGTVEREPMRAVRRATAARLSHAWTAIPRVTQHDKADITQLEQFRKQYSKKAEARGSKTTITAFALKVTASALKKFPQFAASIDPAREEIVYKKYCHIGVAVDTDRGLLVPVIRDVDRKNILELSVELGVAAEKARSRKLTPEEMEGGVFTITNLGGIGGTSFTPIVNWPEVAILGISRSSIEPVYAAERFEPRLMLPLSLSYDHRLIDGADAARFLRWVAEALEQLFLVPFEG